MRNTYQKILQKQNLLSLLGLLIWSVVSFLYMPDSYQAFSFLFLIPWVWKDGPQSMRWVVPLVFLYTLVQHLYPKPNLSLDSLLVTMLPGLVALGFVAWLRERDRRSQKELEDSLRFMHLLEEGSLNISTANDPLELTESAMSSLHNLNIAPHLAFVRFREGKPVVVSARGALERYRGRHLPQQKLSTHASLTDTFVVGNYLRGHPRECGLVYGGSSGLGTAEAPLGGGNSGSRGQ